MLLKKKQLIKQRLLNLGRGADTITEAFANIEVNADLHILTKFVKAIQEQENVDRKDALIDIRNSVNGIVAVKVIKENKNVNIFTMIMEKSCNTNENVVHIVGTTKTVWLNM